MYKDFSYQSYKKLLEILVKDRMNISFKDYTKINQEDNFFILRHDVDLSPEFALKMAEIEAEAGIRATYFLLLSSPFYNLFSEEYVSFPRMLVEMGHEVGLHYDTRILNLIDQKNPRQVLLAQCNQLSEIADSQVTSISMHQPSVNGEDPFRNISDLVNAYSDDFTKKISYFSDSCGAWSDEFVKLMMEENFPLKLQLLIHPIFWGEKFETRWRKLDKLIKLNYDKLQKHSEIEKKIWMEHPIVLQNDARESQKKKRINNT